MKRAASMLRAGDVILAGGVERTVKRVAMNRKGWNHAQIYFREGGSTRVLRETEFEVTTDTKGLHK